MKNSLKKRERIAIANQQIQQDILQKRRVHRFIKWSLLALFIGIAVGTSSSFFLYALEWVTTTRIHNAWLLYVLPIGGLLTGLIYFYFGKEAAKGNVLLLEAINDPEKKIPFYMAPLVFIGTLISHLFGASAGREGTALQMSAAIAEQIAHPFNIPASHRKIVLRTAIAAGFGSVFGTPFAGIVFAFEILFKRDFSLFSLWSVSLATFVAHTTTHFIGPVHTTYVIENLPKFSLNTIFITLVIGIIFGICAWLFVHSMETSKSLFNKIKYPPIRPLLGGIALVLLMSLLETRAYEGLGIDQIVRSFQTPAFPTDFLLKLGLTVLTISAGFKGGEVTPLFFIGATLGSTLSLLIPMPTAFLAGMGFVAVFAGATKTPLACSMMAMELFGIPYGIYALPICLIAVFVAGKKSIYAV